VTPAQLAELIDQYRSGIQAELTLLRQLSDIAQRQREVSDAGQLDEFRQAADARDRLMWNLVTVEDGLRQIRITLTRHRDVASHLPGFDDVAALHREAANLVSAILATDQRSLDALTDAELARRSAVASLERGETTLAAYRRVLAPPTSGAALVDRRG